MLIKIAGNLPVKLGFIELSNCLVGQSPAEIIKILNSITASGVLSDEPVVQQIRQLFRSVGIDPTHYRPSSEALLRRAQKGEPVRSINSMVDVNNICSMEYHLPFGCYDADKIVGDIKIRLGKVDEEYDGVAKKISIADKLCSADDLGAFGSPISDSARTKVTEQTKNVLVLAFGHTTTPDDHILSALRRFCALCATFSICPAVSMPDHNHLRRGSTNEPLE